MDTMDPNQEKIPVSTEVRPTTSRSSSSASQDQTTTLLSPAHRPNLSRGSSLMHQDQAASLLSPADRPTLSRGSSSFNQDQATSLLSPSDRPTFSRGSTSTYRDQEKDILSTEERVNLSRASSAIEFSATPPLAPFRMSSGLLLSNNSSSTAVAEPSPAWLQDNPSRSSVWTVDDTSKTKGVRTSVFPAATPSISSAALSVENVSLEDRITVLHERDDVDLMVPWKRYLYFLSPFLAVATLISYWLYFAIRIRFTLDAQHLYEKYFPLAWLFIAVELGVAFPIFIQSFWTVFVLKKRGRNKLRLTGDEAPTVDVLITCCGEDDDLVLDTARATCHIDYPADRFRVIILDDGKSEGLEKGITGIQKEFPNLHYRSRPKFPGVPHHFKAGNLNYGLDETLLFKEGPAQFVAALDADMIPEPHWLRALVPHLLRDTQCALACPPQLFYNVPANDPLCQSLDFFVHVSEPIKDALGVAWCTGSGYVVRRDALDRIGRFPIGSLAEDVATSTLLLGQGWNTAYVHEPLQFGTVPDSYGSHLKQRTRWCIGTIETAVKLRFCLWGAEIKKLTVYQRMSSFVYAIASLFNVFLTLSLFALPVVLISNKPLVAYANDAQLHWLIRACFMALFCNRCCELVLFLPAGYATGQNGARAQLWMSPYMTLTIFRSFILPKWLGGQASSFKPSGSISSDLNERDPKLRAPMWRRLKVITWNYLALFHVAYIAFCLAAVILSTVRCAQKPTWRESFVCLLTHAYWPPVAWIIVCSSFWIPLSYAISPPTVPDREELLERDPKTQVAHPTEQSKKIAFKPTSVLFELEYCLMTAFTTFVFVVAFFY